MENVAILLLTAVISNSSDMVTYMAGLCLAIGSLVVIFVYQDPVITCVATARLFTVLFLAAKVNVRTGPALN